MTQGRPISTSANASRPPTARRERRAARPGRRGRVVVATLLAAALPLAVGVPATQAAKAKAAPAKLVLTKAVAASARVTVAGRVTLPRTVASSAVARKRVRVALTLSASRGKPESFSTTIDARRRFAVTRPTRLTGRLTLRAQVRIAGRASGKRASRSLTLAAARPSPGAAAGSTAPAPGAGAGPAAQQPAPLVGLFRLDPGVQSPRSATDFSGTYFQMISPAGTPFPNGSSTASNKDYTPLSPGVDGGLRTDGFQAPPSPPFAKLDPTDPSRFSGDALANRIVLPQKFVGVDFSIVTAASDPQTATPDPLPVILASGATLSGQTTAWAAQWNGLSFNQGAPKPDGSSPGRTTAVSGTYDAASRHFVLTWKSLIVGGPFDGYTGSWHLEGTFVPAG